MAAKNVGHTKPKIPANETERLAALKKFDILDTPPEKHLDDITLLASQICDTPIALISLIDENRQWFKSHHGTAIESSIRDFAFCAHAINETKTFIVDDALADARFKQNPLVTDEPKVRFYAGAQLATAQGLNIGTLCVIDHKPKHLTSMQIQGLETLSRQVINNFERRRLENELAERERFLSNILGTIPDLVCYIDDEFKYRYVNSAYSTWYKMDPTHIYGRTIAEVRGEQAFKQVKKYMDLTLSGKPQEFQTTFTYQIQDKAIQRTVWANYIPDKHPNGSIVGFFAVIRDITALKNAETAAINQGKMLKIALKKAIASEHSFRAIFDNAPMGMIQIDSDHRLIATNPAFQDFIGYTEDELRNMSIFEITHPEDMQITKKNITELPKQSGPLYRFEKRYITKSGGTVWGLITSRAVRENDDGDFYLLSVIEDVTEIRSKDAQLKEAQAKMISSAKMASLGEMAGGVAHEINNPLTIIHGQAEFLEIQIAKGRLDQERISRGLNTIKITAERIAKIVKGLREFSRNGEHDPMEVVSIESILQSTLDLCKERFTARGIEIRVSSFEDALIKCKPTQISQILTNLLNNAYDVVDLLPEKWIHIDAVKTAETIQIRVMDSGKGIPAKVAERIMEPFFTTKEVGKGTGLGLSISQGIAHSHHGRLFYDTKAPNTRFILELPLQKS